MKTYSFIIIFYFAILSVVWAQESNTAIFYFDNSGAKLSRTSIGRMGDIRDSIQKAGDKVILVVSNGANTQITNQYNEFDNYITKVLSGAISYPDIIANKKAIRAFVIKEDTKAIFTASKITFHFFVSKEFCDKMQDNALLVSSLPKELVALTDNKKVEVNLYYDTSYAINAVKDEIQKDLTFYPKKDDEYDFDIKFNLKLIK